MRSKDVERVRLLVVKLGCVNFWSTKDIVSEIQKRYNLLVSKRTIQRWKKLYRIMQEFWFGHITYPEMVRQLRDNAGFNKKQTTAWINGFRIQLRLIDYDIRERQKILLLRN